MSLAFDGLPPLRAVLAEHGIDPKRSLGQNFLLDLNLTGRIARQALPLADHTVIEVGPGPGGLTRALLAEGAGEVVAIEKDERVLPALAAVAAHYPGRLRVVHADALTLDAAALAPAGRPVKIVANLPYNVGTELLTRWVAAPVWPPRFAQAVLMFQREVAERIVARPGDEAYGRLGVLCGWRTRARILFDVSREAFTPPPKVTSAVVDIRPVEEPEPADLDAFERVTKAAFGQRRKMLRQSLKGLGGEALLARVGIDPQRRAETLSVAEFVALANALQPQA